MPETVEVLYAGSLTRLMDEVIGPAFERIARGEATWYEVLQQPGLRFGRSDPDRDPGGYLTLLTCQLAELAYAQPGLKARLVGPDRNPDQMPPVAVLRRGLETGELDATMAYRNAVLRRAPYVELPGEVSLSDPRFAAAYARVSYTITSGHTFRGGLVAYTATVLRAAPHPEAAAAFVAYLLSPAARALLLEHGLLATPATLVGEPADVPERVRTRSTLRAGSRRPAVGQAIHLKVPVQGEHALESLLFGQRDQRRRREVHRQIVVLGHQRRHPRQHRRRRLGQDQLPAAHHGPQWLLAVPSAASAKQGHGFGERRPGTQHRPGQAPRGRDAAGVRGVATVDQGNQWTGVRQNHACRRRLPSVSRSVKARPVRSDESPPTSIAPTRSPRS